MAEAASEKSKSEDTQTNALDVSFMSEAKNLCLFLRQHARAKARDVSLRST
jgi:hypothetical protein